MAEKQQIVSALVSLADENHLFDEPAASMMNKDLIDECMIDSMTLMQLQALVEEKFKVSIPSATVIKQIRTLDDLAGYIAKNA